MQVARAAGVQVIARSSAAQFAGADARRAGRELGAHAVIEGSIRPVGDRVEVTAQVVETAQGIQLFNNIYTGPLADAVAAQREIASALGLDVRFTVALSRRALVRPDRHTSEAYRLYLQAVYIAAGDSPDTFRRAIHVMRQAVGADERFAMAWAGIARNPIALAEQDAAPTSSVCAEAGSAAGRAVALDPALVEAYLARGWHTAVCEWNWKAAERDFEMAIGLDPSFLLAQYDYGRLLNMTGRPAEAARVYRQALAAEPTWNWLLNGLASSLIKSGRYQEAVEPIERSLAVRRSAGVLMYRGMLEAEIGKHDAALRWFEEALRQAPRSTSINGRFGYSLAKLGRVEEARKVAALLTAPGERQVAELEVAAVYSGLGDADQAMRWLEKAYSRRAFTIAYAKVDYRFRDLRDERRFQDLLGRVGLL